MVKTQEKEFDLTVQSEAPMTGWILKNESGSQTLGKGGLAATYQFSTKIQRAFQGNFKLTVFLSTEEDSVPVALQLGSKKTATGLNIPAEAQEEYDENPDHPYHAMVHSLYEQAVNDLSKGDRYRALSHLKKAAELDPLQPQVRNLLEKTEGTPPHPAVDQVEQARTVWKSGDQERALSQLDDILANDPNNENALALKKEIIRKRKKEHSQYTPKKPRKAEKTPTPINEKETQAKADQAYNLGLESYRKNDYAAAKKFWEETLRILPTHPQARRNLERLQQDHPELK